MKKGYVKPTMTKSRVTLQAVTAFGSISANNNNNDNVDNID